MREPIYLSHRQDPDVVEAVAMQRFSPIPHAMAGKREGEGGSDVGTATKVRPKTKKPSLYRVLLLNDDYTPMEFVIAILQEVFAKSQEDAFQIMMHVHKNGVGECGVFPFEIAETKVMRVMDAAQKNQHPLQCVMEKQ